MRNIIFALNSCMLILCSNCAGNMDENRNIISLAVFAKEWRTEIAQDGSGSIGYGSNLVDSSPLPPDTFDFAATRKRILASDRSDKPDKEHRVTISLRMSDGMHSTIYVRNADFITDLFRKGKSASPNQRIRELWDQHPIE